MPLKCLWCSKDLPANRIKFCSDKHKDKYHNLHNPRGFYKHLKEIEPDLDDDGSWDAHKEGRPIDEV